MVACADAAIAEAVSAHGGDALLTDPELPSGTDRIYEALRAIDPERRFDQVINLQGDLPTLEAAAIRASLEPLERLGSDIGTLAVATEDPEEKADPSVVKAVISLDARSPAARPRALLHPGHGAERRGAGVPSHRHLCLPPRYAWSASPPCRPARWSSASGSSSCARWRPA